ncbi:MAG TPA: hypothetical protein VF744_20845 [Beijerinckiaceae bacterium]|jgi:hypothetical protein
MTRDEALALYRPVRAGIQRVLKVAPDVCSRAEWARAGKQLGIWSSGGLAIDDDRAVDMLTDIVLFEQDPKGRRAYDRFLERQAGKLAPADRELATRMAGAFFSVFRLAGRHEAAGVRVEDVMNANRPIWLLDESLEKSAPAGLTFGMRLFDAGPFHAGFGIVVPLKAEVAGFFAEAAGLGAPLRFRHSLAAMLYGEAIAEAFDDAAED